MQEAVNLFSLFISRLESHGLRYMVTGAAASIVYGEPRLTHDVDMVIEMKAGDARRIIDAFSSDQFYCPPVEVMEQEARRSLRGHFNVIHKASGFKADFYLKGEDPLHLWAMAERRSVEMDGLLIWVAPPEYVILRKLEYYREGRSEKHLTDIIGMINISLEEIDLNMLLQKIEKYGLEKEWAKIQSFLDRNAGGRDGGS